LESTQVRRYTVREVTIILGVASAVVVLLDAAGLRDWASGLELGPERQVALAITEPIAAIQGRAGLQRPHDLAREWFLSAVHIEHGGGWDTQELQSPVWAEEPAAPTADSAQPEELAGPPLPPRPRRVLLIGDSLMGWGLGTSLERLIAQHPGMEVKRHAVVSSGLTRPDFFDWFDLASGLLDEQEYDAVVCIMGGNDIQAISTEGRVYRHGTDEWYRAYAHRARSFVTLLASKGGRTYWLSLPPMRDKRFHENTRRINAMFEEGCRQRPTAKYVDTGQWIGNEDGEYTSYLVLEGRQRQVRASDGIHLTTAGGEILASRVYDMLVKDLEPPSP